MSEEKKDDVEIVDLSEGNEELDAEEIKELENIIDEVTEDEKDEEVSSDKLVDIEETIDQKEESSESSDVEKESKSPVTEDETGKNKETSTNDTAPTVTAEDLGVQDSETPKEPKEDKAPIITNHVVPQDECWLIKRNKTGFTIPKELREKIHPQQNFALVFEGHELVFYMINEEDIPKLRLVRKKKIPKKKGKRRRRGKKKKEGPEPDFPRYFHFEIEDQNKVQDALESSFYKFAEKPPQVGDAMNIIIHVLTAFIKNHRMNDSRLRQTVIFFLCHIIEQFNQPQLIDFCQREIIDEIESAYLYQICLNQLAYTSFVMGRPAKADEFITKCIDVINKYDVEEMYAIMDSFKHLVHTLTPIQGKQVSKEDLDHVKTSLMAYQGKLEDIDYQVQYIEMLERMDFKEEAYNAAKTFMDKLDMESPQRDQFKAIRRRIGKPPEEAN